LSFSALLGLLPGMERRYLFLLSSARAEGNSVALARAAAAPLPPMAQVWINLADPALPPYRDLRPGTALPKGDMAAILAATREASDIVFVAPVYWYALPAPAKALLDHWSGWLDATETGFASWAQEKTVHLITTRADPDPSVTEPLEAMLRRSVLWLGMRWGGALHGVGDSPGEIAQDHAALTAAAGFLTGNNP
jgi:NAD(P)H-dependent FMN reductase